MAEYFLGFEIFLLHLLILQVNSEPVFLDDTPKCTDIDTYLNAVENALNFTKSADLNHDIALGLLITRDNIHAALTINLPDDQKERTLRLSGSLDYVKIGNNFPLTGDWTDHLGLSNVFNLSHVPPLDQKPIVPVKVKFSSVEEYLKVILEVDSIIALSTMCMFRTMNWTRVNTIEKCPSDKKCLYFVGYGSDYGYGITHRLLFIILSNAQGCYVFKPNADEKIKHKFCSAIYSEAQYIANNDFLYVDLLMESVCLCAPLGFTQLLSRKWFSKILALQADYGCFENTQFPLNNARHFHIDNICGYNHSYAQFLKKRNCDPHLTTVSMAALSIAARFTMQKCYGIDSGKLV